MNARAWTAGLATAGGLVLGVGLPVVAFRTLTPTEIASGSVLWVDTTTNTLAIQDDGGAARLRGHEVVIHLRSGQRVRLGHLGDEPLADVVPGQHLRARVGIHPMHRARWVAVGG